MAYAREGQLDSKRGPVGNPNAWGHYVKVEEGKKKKNESIK